MKSNVSTIIKIESADYTSPLTSLDFTKTDNDLDSILTLSVPRLTFGFNSLLDVKFNDPAQTILDFIYTNYPEQLKKFYMIHYPENDRMIELSDTYKLSSYPAFCDYNNIANKWILATIDFKNSDIRIATTSLKR